MLCVRLGYNLATVFYGPVIYSVPLMLMSTGFPAPLAPMAIPGAASTLANSIFNIVIVVIYCKTRESTNKDYCCCFFLFELRKYVTNMIVGHCLVSLLKVDFTTGVNELMRSLKEIIVKINTLLRGWRV